jgi:predicted NBD/HSP70 family sugar kinase
MAFRAGVEGLALVNDRLRMASGRRAAGESHAVVDPAGYLLCGRANCVQMDAETELVWVAWALYALAGIVKV